MSFRFPVHALSSVLILCLACGGDEGATADSIHNTWITEPEYHFGDAPEKDVFFEGPYVRADPGRDRVFVFNFRNNRISAWTPDGSLLFAVGGTGVGPGEFTESNRVYIAADGSFSVRDGFGSRFTYFSADGALERTVPGTNAALGYDGFRLNLEYVEDGSYVGMPQVALGIQTGTRTGAAAPRDRPVTRQPVLRVRRSETGQWLPPEPLLWLDFSSQFRPIQLPQGIQTFAPQPFAGTDQVLFEPGAVVVMRRQGIPGAVELIEVDTRGDTVWHRDLQFEPRKLTPRMVEEYLDREVEFHMNAPWRMSPGAIRDAFSQGLQVPEYLPGVSGMRLTASGDVWLRGPIVSDTLRTYHVVRRGEMEAEPRRVLLPRWFALGDATATHVWGIRRDALDVPHVVGRRLVPAG